MRIAMILALLLVSVDSYCQSLVERKTATYQCFNSLPIIPQLEWLNTIPEELEGGRIVMMAIYNVDDHQVIIKRLQRSGYEFIGIRNVVGNDGAKRDFVVYGNYNEDQTECCSLEFVQDEEQAFVVIEHVKLD